jgi:isopenicillin N synthase-like dioxygenase
MMTLLATNDVPGLEILVNDQWHPVEPRQDMYIVNLGDCEYNE